MPLYQFLDGDAVLVERVAGDQSSSHFLRRELTLPQVDRKGRRIKWRHRPPDAPLASCRASLQHKITHYGFAEYRGNSIRHEERINDEQPAVVSPDDLPAGSVLTDHSHHCRLMVTEPSSFRTR
jgi:hypothetical protein